MTKRIRSSASSAVGSITCRPSDCCRASDCPCFTPPRPSFTARPHPAMTGPRRSFSNTVSRATPWPATHRLPTRQHLQHRSHRCPHELGRSRRWRSPPAPDRQPPKGRRARCRADQPPRQRDRSRHRWATRLPANQQGAWFTESDSDVSTVEVSLRNHLGPESGWPVVTLGSVR